MPKVILTGATGLVGSRFVEMFGDQFEISNLDIATGVDITKADQVKQFIKSHPSDALIHLAAFTDTTRAEAEKGDKSGLCYQVNVVGTENIAKVASAHGIHLVHISTDFVYDGAKSSAYIEDDPTCPLDWYGETKAMAEQVVARTSQSATILRLSYPYRANFALKPDLIQKIRTGLADNTLPPQFSDTLITPTFIDDLCQAFAAVITHKPQGIYHTVGSQSLSPYALAQKVSSAYGFDPNLVKEGSLTEYLKVSPRPYARSMVLSNAKATQDFGIHFASLDEGLIAVKKQQS